CSSVYDQKKADSSTPAAVGESGKLLRISGRADDRLTRSTYAMMTPTVSSPTTGQRSERSAGAATATAGLATVASSETLAYLTVLPNVFLNADRAAWYPHIPCTPPPGGVDDEQMYKPSDGVR